jgi:hypothetical protein
MATDEDTNEVEGAQADGAMNGEDSLLKGAAKVATIGAVVGAAFGAARAVTGRQSQDDDAQAQNPGSSKVEEPPEPDDRRSSRRERSHREEPQGGAEEGPDEDEETEERDEQEADGVPTAAAPGEQRGRNGGAPEEPEAADDDDEADEARSEQSSRDGGAAVQIIRKAREQLAEVTGRTPEAVLGLEKRGDGWLVTVEVLEMARIPNSTDVLAAYEAHLDADGDLVEYTRTQRYHRGRTGGEEGA